MSSPTTTTEQGPGPAGPELPGALSVSDDALSFFRAFGYLKLPGAVAALTPHLFSEVAGQMERTYGDTRRPPAAADDGRLGYFLPAMSERTPTSLRLLDVLAPAAARLLGAGQVAPVYADTTVFFGPTPWHTDIGMDLGFVKFASYADPVDATGGALRFVPGSHEDPLRRRCKDIVRRLPVEDDRSAEAAISSLPHVIVDMDPGDVVAIDGHVWHATVGHGRRLQWSLPFIDATDEVLAGRFYESFFIDASVRGYDGREHPFYGTAWLDSHSPQAALLSRLGAVRRAEETAAR